MTDADRLLGLFRAGHPGLHIATFEEAEARAVVLSAAASLGAQAWSWSLLEGVQDVTPARPAGAPAGAEETTNPAAGLYWLARQPLPAVHLLLDVGAHAEDPHAMRALRVLLERAAEAGSHVVMIDCRDRLPGPIEAMATRFDLSLPSDDALDEIVRTTLKSLHRVRPIEIALSGRDYAQMLKNLRGLTRRQAAQVVRDVVADDRRLDSADLPAMVARKRQIVSVGGALEFVESPATLDEVGGLARLKSWLVARQRSFDDKAAAFGLSPPRGVLMLGVQGAGKSLCAKAIAAAWQRPLLRLDPGTLYDRYVGESERRLRDALRQAEATAPVVLWIDEIEKGFAGAASQSTDGGLSQRMFGTLLTWMQDHRAPVFTVATANNIEALPPELLRKGRFDEIFFVDLPGEEARRAIFAIHLRKRGRDPARFDTERLAEESEGFSGSEIEQAVLAAMHEAFHANGEPTTEAVSRHLRESPPLSVTMAERIERLRAWAVGRCVPAD